MNNHVVANYGMVINGNIGMNQTIFPNDNVVSNEGIGLDYRPGSNFGGSRNGYIGKLKRLEMIR
jgi:hypothetical protein